MAKTEFADGIKFNNLHESEDSTTEETELPVYLQTMYATRQSHSQISFLDKRDETRGHWDARLIYILYCIGYTSGIGNIFSFPIRVYRGGGGTFFIPYFIFCIIFGCPMMILEMGLGQFCGRGCSKAFEMCPFLSGIGWTIFILAFIILTTYAITVSWCLLYLVFSFHYTPPWTVCTNTFNNAKCINTSVDMNYATNNSNFESSAIQFWNLYVTGEQREDGSFLKISDKLGYPSVECVFCLLAIIGMTSSAVMLGVKISGKFVYVLVIFPYLIMIQFIILGCTLPGALSGIKFYLYPNFESLQEPDVYFNAIKHLFFSVGIASGGLIILSSYNSFKDNIYENVMIIMVTDFLISFISGFATFTVLGSMSHKVGKQIKDLIEEKSYLFFVLYPEILSMVSSSNLWTILLMLMLLLLGIVSIFIYLDTLVMAILDHWSISYTVHNKIIVTSVMCTIITSLDIVLITPGGYNWIVLFESNVKTTLSCFSVMMEILIVFGIYGIYNFQHDIQLMTNKTLSRFIILPFSISALLVAFTMFVMSFVIYQPIERHGNVFPKWTAHVSIVFGLVILSPVFIKAFIILVKYKTENWKMSFVEYLKLCLKAPPNWGPKSVFYWAESKFYSEKLLKYKDQPQLVYLLSSLEQTEIAIKKAEMTILRDNNSKS